MENKKNVSKFYFVSFCLVVISFIIAAGLTFAVDNKFVFAESSEISSNWLSEDISFVSGLKIEERSSGDVVTKFLIVEINVRDNDYVSNISAVGSSSFEKHGDIIFYDCNISNGSDSSGKQFSYSPINSNENNGFNLIIFNENKIFLYFVVPNDFFSIHNVSNLGFFIPYYYDSSIVGNSVFGSLNVACYSEYLYNLGLSCGSSDSALYQQGYDVGYSKGVEYVENNKSLGDLIFSIVDAPFNVLKNAFDFEILGYNIGSLLSAVVSLLLLAFVVKLLI